MTDAFQPLAVARQERGRRRSSANMIARAILGDHHFITDRQKTTYRYNGRHWEEAPDQWLLWLALDKAGQDSTHKQRQEIVHYIKAESYDDLLEWGRVGDGEVACMNGVVDVLLGRLRKHEREDRLERVIPWTWKPGGLCPVWDACLTEWFGDDEGGAELIGALQEFAGYVCMAHAKFKKALVLKGPSDTGKSQVVFVLEQLAGQRFTCQLSVEHMDDPERRSVIKGMSLNVMSELSAEALIADGGFKTLISTEEPIMLSAKYKPTEMYRPTAKHVIATNNLPVVNDHTAATFNRMLILPMDKIIPKEAQDRQLQDKLRREMEGIFAWAVEGAKRLIARGGVWPEPARSRELVAEYRASQNAAKAFMEECWREEPGQRTPLYRVAERYNDWNRGGRRVDHRRLTKLLRDAGYPISRQRIDDGRIVTCLLDHVFVALPQESNAKDGQEPATPPTREEPPAPEGDGR